MSIIRAAVSGSGANFDLVAAASGKRIRVLSLWLQSDNTYTVTIKSGASTNLTGPLREATVIPINLDYNERGHFETAVGEALTLYNGTSQGVSGCITYLLLS